MVTIREITTRDAAAFLELSKKLDAETAFLMLEPSERTTTVAEQREQIKNILARDNQTILVAESDGELVGRIDAIGGNYRRNRHSVYIVIAVLQGYAGQGIGTRLFAALEAWARARGIHRLELTVMTHNERAVALYKKMGFALEGTKKDSLCVDGAYVDEYYMAKLLGA